MTHTPRTTAAEPSPDLGFSLLEILLIVMLSGILSAIVVYSVSGMTASASDGTCAVEQRILYTATEAYFNQTETNQIAPTGTDEDRYERTLAEGGFLRSVSDVLTLHADGTVTTENDGPCWDDSSPAAQRHPLFTTEPTRCASGTCSTSPSSRPWWPRRSVTSWTRRTPERWSTTSGCGS